MSVQATLAVHPAVAIGNVVGSNIADIGLILGVAALIAPARVDGALRSRELPVLLAATALVPATLIDGTISRIECAVLLACGVLYTTWMIRAARAGTEVAAARQVRSSSATWPMRRVLPRRAGRRALRSSRSSDWASCYDGRGCGVHSQ